MVLSTSLCSRLTGVLLFHPTSYKSIMCIFYLLLHISICDTFTAMIVLVLHCKENVQLKQVGIIFVHLFKPTP